MPSFGSPAPAGGCRGPTGARPDRSYPVEVNTVLLGLPGRWAAPHAGARPDDQRLLDTFGRVTTDLRVSLTDKCSLRCTYCMLPEGLDWLPGEQVLTDAEV